MSYDRVQSKKVGSGYYKGVTTTAPKGTPYRTDPLVDLEFDDSSHAPVFVYDFRPADSPLRVLMADGKLLSGRLVERVNGKFVP